MIDFLHGLSQGILIALIVGVVISLLSQMALYAKAGQPAVAALVPVWNVVVFCKVLGRPAKHALFLIIPGLMMAGVAVAYWDVIEGLFPHKNMKGIWKAGENTFSDAIIPFSIMGVAAIPLVYFVIVMFTEVCDSFGKHSMMDKLLCIFFNGIYILIVLGISPLPYESAWWSRKRGKPYYMPDFNHKGKRYLITPEGPVEGDYKEQKLKVKSILDEWDPLSGKNLEEVAEADEVSINGAMKVSMLAADLGKKEGDAKGGEVKKSWQEEMKEKYKKE
jgi:hypothetical protein